MGAFAGNLDEPILRIPPTSPSRRDYQLRSVSPSPSRPQSPWRPREQVISQEVDTFRLYESHPQALARSNYYSGPLPSAPQGVDRSFYSGPLPTINPPQPSFSGPLSGFSTTTTESFDFEFATWAKVYHRQHDSNSVPGSPEVASSQEGKSVRGRHDDDAESVEDEPSLFYLSNPAESRARAAAEFAERAGKYGNARNCVSGELGISEAIAKQKYEVARGYKSGEILGLNICADGIYNSSPPVANVVEDHKSQHSGPTAAWDALMKDAKNDNSNCDSEMVAIPFKWEVSGKARDSVSKKPNSRTSSTSTVSQKPNSRTSSTSTVSQKPNSRTSSTSTVSQKANSRTSSTSTVSQKPKSRTSLTSAVSQKPDPRTSSTSTMSQKPNSRTSSNSTVSQKPNSRTSSSSNVSQKPNSRTSSSSTQDLQGFSTGVKSLKSEFSFGGSHKFYGGATKASEKAESVIEEADSTRGVEVSVSDVVAPPALKPVRTATPSPKATQQQEEVPRSPFSVPFKWEDEPGKAKSEVEHKARPEEVAPALQLPPRLASASVKSRSPSLSISALTKPTKSTKQSRGGSASELTTPPSVGKHSRQGSGVSSSRKFFDKDCFRRCRRLLVNLF